MIPAKNNIIVKIQNSNTPGRMASNAAKWNDQPGRMASSGTSRNDQPKKTEGCVICGQELIYSKDTPSKETCYICG